MCAHRGKGYEVVPLIQLYNKPIEQKKDEMKRDRPGYYVHGRGAPSIKKKKKILPQQFFFFVFFSGCSPFLLRSTWGLYNKPADITLSFIMTTHTKITPLFFVQFFFSFSIFHCGYCRPREAVETLFYRSCIFSQR